MAAASAQEGRTGRPGSGTAAAEGDGAGASASLSQAASKEESVTKQKQRIRFIESQGRRRQKCHLIADWCKRHGSTYQQSADTPHLKNLRDTEVASRNHQPQCQNIELTNRQRALPKLMKGSTVGQVHSRPLPLAYLEQLFHHRVKMTAPALRAEGIVQSAIDFIQLGIDGLVLRDRIIDLLARGCDRRLNGG